MNENHPTRKDVETQLFDFMKMLVSANTPFNFDKTEMGNKKITYRDKEGQVLMMFLFDSQDNLDSIETEPIS
jgi:hypothetical protein